MRILVSLSVIVGTCICVSNIEPPKIVLPHGGGVVGSYMTSVGGKGILAFRGIPYAEPPIGDLRFQAPEPIKPWVGEKLTNKDPNVCIQINPYERNFTVFGEEDCLYLNVYVPQSPTNFQQLPVMVYIHGGGWVTGNGNSNVNGPERLLDHDVILVIGNYRLGALGFLSTGTKDCPGNNGFKDQLLILKWVKHNIKVFGGDPDDVTLFGESAGSVSVAYHMYSHASKGLFHKAIMQSGSIFSGWAVVDSSIATHRASKLGRLMNCTHFEDNWMEMIECLKKKPAADIVLSVKEYFEFDIDPVIAFAGVVEVDHEGSFLSKHPKDINPPPNGDIPLIIGGTADEGVIKSAPILNLLNEEFTRKFYEVLPIISGYKNKPKDILTKILEQIDEFYFKDGHNWSKQNHQNLTNLFSDQRFNFGMDKFLRRRFASSNATDGKTFVYLFDHRGPKSASEFFHGGQEYYGVCHTDDLPYIFYNNFSKLKGDENDTKLKTLMPELWTNFARTGNPTPEGTHLPLWLPAEGYPLQYAHIGSKNSEDWVVLRNEKGFLKERIQFWRKLEEEFDI
ncbi:unnamed protein product [Hermetia illucens]|uniref:Carboxylic ester hydrolase n=1 Tax=Hermetia illucens TaxID=343691 RepID=A0A7R8UVD1_HERIL|nr:esterase E4-like [Hermetia illucens]CAD7087657.1 unnamed protein product [Hermetia illucens]